MADLESRIAYDDNPYETSSHLLPVEAPLSVAPTELGTIHSCLYTEL